MYKIHLNYAHLWFTRLNIIINDHVITPPSIDTTITLDVPYQTNTLQIKNNFIQSSVIEVQDGDVILVKINPFIWLFWGAFLLTLCLGQFSFLQLAVYLLITRNYGIQLKIASSITTPQLTLQK